MNRFYKMLTFILIIAVFSSMTTFAIAEGDAQESKILIAYFAVAENSEVDAVSSASVVRDDEQARGFSRLLADQIHDVVGGDMFSIQTSVDYPADFGAVIDQAAQEQSDNARPELITHIENVDQYDTIFVGYPLWWYDIPQVMYSFFDEYDLSGKTIIPFCTHNGSGFDDTIETIAELEPEANVVTDGFTVQFDRAPDASQDVAKWLESLGF